ncbi:hypothetical protein CDD83_5593 [Cordyceps sp. RAO-2017]|nr:hypothetical protein CDD83_5593 [Cordyceps sp. RAO-2017]
MDIHLLRYDIEIIQHDLVGDESDAAAASLLHVAARAAYVRPDKNVDSVPTLLKKMGRFRLVARRRVKPVGE